MSDFSVRSENVDVEQIMRQIRARIREKRGVDYTEDEIRELANVKLEKFIDPKGVRSGLLEEYRRVSTPEPPAPNYSFGEDTLYETHRGPIRWLRSIFRPLLKLLFNPNPLIQALHIQSELNTRNAERTARRERLDALHYEVIHNLVVELTRTGVEVKALKMRLESMASRLDFDERRARSLEGVVQYRAGAVPPLAPPTGQDQGRQDQGRPDQGRQDQGRQDQARRDQGRRDQGPRNQGGRDQRSRDQGSRDQGPRGPRPPGAGSDRGQTGGRPGSDQGQTGVRPGSDQGPTGIRPSASQISQTAIPPSAAPEPAERDETQGLDSPVLAGEGSSSSFAAVAGAGLAGEGLEAQGPRDQGHQGNALDADGNERRGRRRRRRGRRRPAFAGEGSSTSFGAASPTAGEGLSTGFGAPSPTAGEGSAADATFPPSPEPAAHGDELPADEVSPVGPAFRSGVVDEPEPRGDESPTAGVESPVGPSFPPSPAPSAHGDELPTDEVSPVGPTFRSGVVDEPEPRAAESPTAGVESPVGPTFPPSPEPSAHGDELPTDEVSPVGGKPQSGEAGSKTDNGDGGPTAAGGEGGPEPPRGDGG